MTASRWSRLLALSIQYRAPGLVITFIEGRFWDAVLRERGVLP
jgi:hypothetical protein